MSTRDFPRSVNMTPRFFQALEIGSQRMGVISGRADGGKV